MNGVYIYIYTYIIRLILFDPEYISTSFVIRLDLESLIFNGMISRVQVPQ